VASISSHALKALARLCPLRVGHQSLDFCITALESSEEHVHQAPAAIKLLTSLAGPLLRPAPVLCLHLPRLLSLTLQGLDANDQGKTTDTLAFYVTLLAYLPIGEHPDDNDSNIGQDATAAREEWIKGSPLEDWSKVSDDDAETMLVSGRDAGVIMAEWAVAFLDRMLKVTFLPSFVHSLFQFDWNTVLSNRF